VKWAWNNSFVMIDLLNKLEMVGFVSEISLRL